MWYTAATVNSVLVLAALVVVLLISDGWWMGGYLVRRIRKECYRKYPGKPANVLEHGLCSEMQMVRKADGADGSRRCV